MSYFSDVELGERPCVGFSLSFQSGKCHMAVRLKR
jgi:hypothetical protein